MKTYQDFLQVGEHEQLRMEFCLQAINDYRSSSLYRTARDAELYYDGENPTISRYEKIIYDMKGLAHRDMYTANHKISSSFFGMVVDQQVGYLLGNGVSFGDDKTKDALGDTFDQDIMDAAEYAQIAGVSFCLWNLDHVDVFKATEFVPLYDEENGALCAGIRFWQVAPGKPLRATLYEMDGYTNYLWEDGDGQLLHERRPYKITLMHSAADGTVIYDGENYPTFPIVSEDTSFPRISICSRCEVYA